MERIPYRLLHPIVTIEGKGESERRVTIDELQLALRVKGRHMRATDTARGPVEAKLLLVSSLAGISRAEADELDEEDLKAIDALYGDEDDVAAIAVATGLPSTARTAAVIAAIGELRRPLMVADPLGSNSPAGSPAGGPGTGPMSPGT